MKLNQYFAHNAEILEDGVLRIGICGTDGDRLCTGAHDVPPGSPDYNFWLWLKPRQKQPWYRWGRVKGLNEQAIAEYREEYDQQT
jgi:hypothetical protein